MSRNQRRNRRNKPGSQAARNAGRDTVEDRSAGEVLHRPSTETKSSLRTTELIAYAGAVLAVVMTALAVDAGDEGGDPFGAEQAIRYITYLTVGYMIARGLAKSGSYETRIDRDTDDDATRTPAGHDRDAHDDLAEPTDDAEPVDTVDRPSDEAQHAGAGTADVKV